MHAGDDADVSLSGNLEDVPLADVLQFIHLGRRTGTLSLGRDGMEAEIGFHNGQIVSARSPSSRSLGEHLVAAGLLDQEALERSQRHQQSQTPRRSLGSTLVSIGAIDGEQLRREIETQIAETVYELVTWTRGVFKFTLDELRPADDVGMFPGDLVPHIDLNTQMVLLEAARIFDERNRTDVAPEPSSDSEAPVEPAAATDVAPTSDDAAPEPEAMLDVAASAAIEDPDSLAALLAGIEDGVPSLPPVGAEAEAEEPPTVLPTVRLQVLTTDRGFFDRLAERFSGGSVRVVKIRPHEAGIGLHGEAPPIVLFDLRQGTVGPQDIRALRRSRPRAPILALVDDSVAIGRVIEAGALAAVPPEEGAVASCVQTIVRNRLDLPEELRSPIGAKAGLARLRRILGDLRSGLLSATVALNLLHIISESVERAILFLVKPHELAALGAFGFSQDGELLAQATRGFRVPRTGGNPLVEAIEDGQVRSVTFDEAGFPDELVQLIGRPETGQVVIIPVLGSQRVISVIYADNGQTTRAIDDIELLELATAQVGMAFENELLRRQAERRS
jgi:hypothetical protein